MPIDSSDVLSLLSGPDVQNGWHSLRESGVETLPAVIEAYHATEDVHIRVEIVRVVSEWRSPKGVEFLASLLQDREPKIWKAALDGLVMSDLPEALVALQSARQSSGEAQRSWFNEAIEQLQAFLDKSGAADGP